MFRPISGHRQVQEWSSIHTEEEFFLLNMFYGPIVSMRMT